MAAHLLIREYYAGFNERRFSDAADLFASSAVLERSPFATSKNGGEGYLQLAELWVRAFPDATLRIDHVEQRGDTICEVDLTVAGTHMGDLTLPAHGVFGGKGLKVTFGVREILEIRGNKITYSSVSFNVPDLIRQMTGNA